MGLFGCRTGITLPENTVSSKAFGTKMHSYLSDFVQQLSKSSTIHQTSILDYFEEIWNFISRV